MPRANAAVTYGHSSSCRVEEIVLDTPRPDEILVRMVAAGMCGTDLGVQLGHIPFPTPGVLGHEGAGVVEEVGSEVTGLAPGDAVLLSYTSCGSCPSCVAAYPALCHQWVPVNLLRGARADGSAPLRAADGGELHGYFFGQSSWATHALVDARCAVRVDPEAPLGTLAPLGCAGQTGAGTVLNVLQPGPGASLAILGAGSVGLCAVMAAALTPATTIIAVDRVPGRLELARELGATHVIDTSQDDLGEELGRITGGAGIDLAADTTANVSVIGAAVASLAVGGTMALVGAPAFGTTVPVDVNGMLPGRKIVGVTEGDCDPRVMLPILATLHGQGRFPVDRIIRTYGLDDVQSAMDDLRSGETIKPVLLM